MLTNELSNSNVFLQDAASDPVFSGKYSPDAIIEYVLSQSANCSLGALRTEGEKALADFFQQNRDELRKLIKRSIDKRLASRLDCSDVIQDLYLECRNRLDTYLQKPQIPPVAWLRKLSRQVTSILHRRHLRTKKRDAKRETRDLDNSKSGVRNSFLADSTSSVGGKLARNESQTLVIEAMEQLSENDRQVLRLKHFEDLSWAEIADRLGVNIETAKKRYRRSLDRLRASTNHAN